MDFRRDMTMTIVKYCAYLLMMTAIFFEKKPNFILLVSLCSLLIVISSVRQYLIDGEKYEFIKKYTFIVDIIIVSAMGYFDRSTVFQFGYFVIMGESILTCPYIWGGIIALTSYISFAALFYISSDIRPFGGFLLILFYNSLGYLFISAVSFAGKRNIEQTKKMKETLDKLDKSKQELEDAYGKLLISNKKIQELAIVEERNRMAREIHDTLAHTLTTIIVETEAAKKLMKKGSDLAVDELEKAQNQARFGLDEVRHSVRNLRAGVLNREGFKIALNTTLGQLEEMGGVQINFEMDENIILDETYEMAFFRVIQEASTNSVRHGKSKNIFINISRDVDEIILNIKDDGSGCDNIKSGFGLLGMKERVKELGGALKIESKHGEGFNIDIKLPVKEDEVYGEDKDTHSGRSNTYEGRLENNTVLGG